MSDSLPMSVGGGSPVRLQGLQNLNVLSASGQQFVITSPVSVPGFQQLSANSPGVQRLVNLSPRRHVGESRFSLLTIGSPPAVSSGRAAAHPTLVTSLASPAANHVSIVTRKRLRPHEIPLPSDPVKRRILDAKLAKLTSMRSRYADSAAELLFLQIGGCLMDYPTWRSRRGAPQQLQAFLHSNRLDPTDLEEDLTTVLSPTEAEPVEAPTSTTPTPDGRTSGRPSLDRGGSSGRQHSIATMGDSGMSHQELIVERAKQEAYVVQRISELQREGLWSERRLPKVQEPPRNKAHWDYLLEEMVWLAQDFNQERKWKKANAKKCAKMVQKYFSDKEILQKKEEKVQELQLRKLANFMAKEVKQFWAGVNKFVEFKQTTRLEEKRKKALDQHLSFIVDQTEKYSEWLAESMNKSQPVANTSTPPSPTHPMSDEEFQPMVSSSDDEETIAKEEEGEDKENNAADEVERLKRESEMPLEDLISDLPEEYLLDRDKQLVDPGGGSMDVDMESNKSEDFTVNSSNETSDDEETMAEQEEAEGKQNHEEELATLEADKDLTVEQLRAKYSGPPPPAPTDTPTHDSDDDDTGSESEETESLESEEEDEAEVSSSGDEDVSLKALVDSSVSKEKDGEQANKEIDDATAIAESLQPKGSTLLTTNVVTPIPFLLRHSLREYQHIGLDWLVTMYDRKLNGILADEMGLGKTIQTIALLAHLACEKGNWGPHLIIVPTSVMLNWEMEFKKWCPAFKILTYYGTIKERKAKRSGWTKPNAFHICIVSYKLVIQDHQSFRRKKWQYLVLDEAQNIKNFRSQRWQLLLNFATQRRLLLTGTPLQNNLMELWSLMHFLMPHVFQSHREFKEWFSNPVTGMLEGNSEYNESIIKRLHKVLRPFLLRRLKTEVEKQLPKKYEHVVMCRLSKRQRFLYEDFMSRAKTKETLASGNLLSVINVLMQLRKVCNHPNLFEVRPIISPFQMEALVYTTASILTTVLDYDPYRHVDLNFLNFLLIDAEALTAYAAYRTRRTCVGRKLIEELEEEVYVPPQPPRTRLRITVRNLERKMALPQSPGPTSSLSAIPPARVGTSPLIRLQNHPAPPLRISGSQVHLIPGTKQAGQVKSGLPVQLVQTSTGRHIFFPLHPQPSNSVIANGERLSQGNLKPPTPPQVTEGTSIVADTPGSTAVTTTMTMSVTRMSPSVTMPIMTSQTNPDTLPLLPTMPMVERRRRTRRRDRLRSLAEVNHLRCSQCPLFGTDLVCTLRVVEQPPLPDLPPQWRWCGHAHCNAARHPALWTTTDALTQAVGSPELMVNRLGDTLSRFVVYVPAVAAPTISMHISHPPPSRLWRERRREAELRLELSPRSGLLHAVVRGMSTQFPDPRLIQYDCGKLQVLDQLLRNLKTGHHKVLLFTQMTRMLDVLEAFLNCHGYIYLRLDGTTKVDQRQVLMERFNGDERIFVFILSTRSGGIGVNLTGADTVIFYDSDWNPTMDAQAQDRCHRIGQTRDVHIYRLISEMTVEENILKKANQKRLLGDLAIEGGNFTTAYFKTQSTIQDLFNVDTSEADASKRMTQQLGGGERERQRTEESAPEPSGLEKAAQSALESALATVEDAPDVEAARTATAEAAAELAEFDENIPLEDGPEPAEPEMSKAEMEVVQLIQQLKPIERYAMRFVEENEAAWSAEQLAAAEKQIEEQKKEWELNRQAALQAEEERMRQEDSELDLTYNREDPTNEVWLCSRTIGGGQMWSPPTPPQEEDDVYIDKSMSCLYEATPLLDIQLPPIFVKKELKRQRVPELSNTLDGRRSMKMVRRDDSPISTPRSLFDHPSSALQKMRRDVKMHKYRAMVRPSGGATTPVTPTIVHDENTPEWTIHEDEKLLQTVEELSGLPTGLMVVHAAQVPNWDLAADIVNMVSCTTRSPSQCRNRYESVIIPREEGKLVYEQKKQKKKTGGLHKMVTQKTNRTLRTKQLVEQDNNLSLTEQFHKRFDMVKSLSLSRKPAPKPLLVNPLLKNPKHAAVLAESGIDYDKPLNPIDIASRRADRIAKDKKMQVAQVAQVPQAAQVVQAAHALTPEQLALQQRQLAAQAAAAKAAVVAQAASQPQPAPAAVNVSVSLGSTVVGTAQVLQAATTSTGAPGPPPAPTQSIVVAAGTPLNSVMQTTGITTLSPALRQARPVGIQEMVVQASQARTATNTTATVVSVANLTPAQLQARIATGSLVSLPATAVKAATSVAGVQVSPGQKTLSNAQVSYYRQQAILRQQTQRIAMREQQGVKVVQGQAKMAQVVQTGTPGQPKTQYVKQGATGVVKARQEDVAALVKQQLQRQQQQKAAGSQAHQQTITTQFLTSAGVQLQATQVATGITIPQLKTTVAGTQQIRQLGLAANYQQLLSKQGRVQTKVTQLTKPSGVPTQLIVQSQAGKAMPSISMQHIQQVMKNVQPQHMTVTSQAVAGGSQVVLAKSAGSGATSLGPRVLPGSQTPRQTIQVVPGTIRTVASVSQVSNSSLASALAGSIKVGQSGAQGQQTFISQVSSLPGIVRQSGVNPVRIQAATSASGTPLMAVTVQQQSNMQQTPPDHGQGQS